VPVYGLQSSEVAGLSPHSSAAEAVEAYCAAIRAKQPRGPYRLLGWSSGGALAMAIASALESTADAVTYLGLLNFRAVRSSAEDSEGQQLLSAMLATLASIRAEAFELSELAGIKRALSVQNLSLTDLFDKTKSAAVGAVLQDVTGVPFSDGMLEQLIVQVNITKEHRKLFGRLEAAAVSGNVQLVWAEESSSPPDLLSLSLERIGPRFDATSASIEFMSCGHYDMLTPPHVTALARLVSTKLQGGLIAP
jgi:thioesterase domain-containing protein